MHPHHIQNHHIVGDVCFNADCILQSPENPRADTHFDNYRRYVNVYRGTHCFILVQGFYDQMKPTDIGTNSQINLCEDYTDIRNALYKMLTPEVIDFLAELQGVL